MTKYEYQIFSLRSQLFDEDDIIFLNELGYKGWELVVYELSSNKGLFKREIKMTLELTNNDGSKELFTIR